MSLINNNIVGILSTKYGDNPISYHSNEFIEYLKYNDFLRIVQVQNE